MQFSCTSLLLPCSSVLRPSASNCDQLLFELHAHRYGVGLLLLFGAIVCEARGAPPKPEGLNSGRHAASHTRSPPTASEHERCGRAAAMDAAHRALGSTGAQHGAGGDADDESASEDQPLRGYACSSRG